MLSPFSWLPLAAPTLAPGAPWWVAGFATAAAAVATAAVIRARREQAKAARASEARHARLFEGASAGLYEMSPDGRFLRANAALARIAGYASAAELLTLSAEDIGRWYVVPRRREEMVESLRANERVARFESEIRRADGTRAWIEEDVEAERDTAGNVIALHGFVSDITAQRDAIAARDASRQRYQVMFDHLPIGIVEYDYRRIAAWFDELRTAGVKDLAEWLRTHPEAVRRASDGVIITSANAAALRLFGLRNAKDDLAGLERLYTTEMHEARREILRALWDGRHEADGEFAAQTVQGRTLRLFYHWRVPVIEGRLQHDQTQLALVDVTEIKAAKQALAAERERLTVTLRAMSEAVVTIDQAGIVQFMNEAAATLTGWPAGAAVGHALREVCVLGSDKASQPLATPLASALSADRPIDLPPYTLVRPREGPPRCVEGRCAPVHDAKGRPIGAVLVMRDVTQRAQLEADLLRASKMESIGVLAGGIAHDFNNLLSIVMGNLSLALLDERAKAAAEKWLREAERGALRARELTQQLLTFAKGGEPVRGAVPLGDLVREAAQFALHGSAVRCEFDIAAELRPADADKGQIGQVVQNLVLNAVQAMPSGGTIKLSLCNETLPEGAVVALPAGNYLRLEIADTGKGIPPEHLARIFEPFFTTKESGSGLGLATVYSVIQKHRGHIAVESTLGKGTTFRIRLPAARLQAPKAVPATAVFEPLRGRVLFMDDEEPIRVMTKALLERLGLEVRVTSDGDEALREYARARSAGTAFDVVIFDLTVPGAMGGADAMREILKIDPAAKGIVSSGYSSDPVMANYRAHGFRGSVPKPYRMADFSRTLREVLEDRGAEVAKP